MPDPDFIQYKRETEGLDIYSQASVKARLVFSIIIPTCNRNIHLVQCLNHLYDALKNFEPSQCQVIVTDDGKNNEAKSLIEQQYPWVKWVEGAKAGPAANRNNGVKYADGQWLIFIDDDCLPDNKLLISYYQASLQHPSSLVFEGRISADRSRQRMDEESPVNEYGGLLWSCNFMIKKNFFQQLDGFNELYLYASMEDVDFRERVKKNTNIHFVKEAFVIHPWRIAANPAEKFEKVFEAHKTYFSFHGKTRNFSKAAIVKNIFFSITRYTIPEIFKFKAKGISYSLQYYKFLFRLLFYKWPKNKD